MLDSGDDAEDGVPERRKDERVSAGGILVKVKRTLTRQNKAMAICRLEDMYGGIDLLLYPKQYEKYKEVLAEDSFAEITGTLTFEGGTKIVCDTLQIISEADAPDAPKQTRKLYLNIVTDEQLNSIYEILDGYPGDVPVVMKRAGKKYDLERGVRYNEGLRHELLTVIEPDGIIFAGGEKM
jgi:DNA polymerase-3 subunit alpha